MVLLLSTTRGPCLPLEERRGGSTPPCARPQSPKIIKKLPENASREVKKSKIFVPRRRGHPFPWTPSPFGPRFFPLRPPLENALTTPLGWSRIKAKESQDLFVFYFYRLKVVDNDSRQKRSHPVSRSNSFRSVKHQIIFRRNIDNCH